MVSRQADRRAAARRLAHLDIECVTPALDAGRHPVKRIVGDTVVVGADVVKDGHDLLAARVLARGPGGTEWVASPMTYDFDTDRWYGAFRVDRIGRWAFTVEAWTDRFGTWRAELQKRVDADQDVTSDLIEGAQFVRAASRSAPAGPARASLLMTAKLLEDRRELDVRKRIQRALDDDLAALMDEYHRRRDLTRWPHELGVIADREQARFSAWYEVFPRSLGPLDQSPQHGTLCDAAARLPRLGELGFDVVYLPPIHPVGHTHRKGKNNTAGAAPEDVGSPWAIGNAHGGHTAIEPALGTLDDFDHFAGTARELDMEVALDYALQCSPDHPWVSQHPEWFRHRPDGTIKYAENPPKKYQDIYPLDFWCDDREGLWNACRDILLFWIGHGVKVFRCDNPHTKPLAFWEWVIREVQCSHPDVIFFSEAFTRPKRMKALAKLGFTMSYTYFTWKNSPWEIQQYFDELTRGAPVEYFRGNLFANTPDILNEYLVRGGRPAFRVRLLLAGTLLPAYGLYSGYELCENQPLRAGSEEYLDSEKYELRPRDFCAPGNLNADIARLNRIRRSQPALQRYANLSFHPSDNPAIVFYRKRAGEPHMDWSVSPPRAVPEPVLSKLGVNDNERGGDLLVVVNTDPHSVQETTVHVPVHEMGLGDDEPYVVEDLLTGARYAWQGTRNYVRLDPASEPGHLLLVRRDRRRA
ncbi:MAG: alpha-1,4-glucan--maltose-1-phosphate maltosyltransferase [Gemmatimonadaceae bacterium]